jgi:hypothetical protein
MLACHGSWQIVMLGRFKDVQRYRISQPLHLRSIYIYLVCYVCCIYIYNYLFITRVHTHIYIYIYTEYMCIKYTSYMYKRHSFTVYLYKIVLAHVYVTK